MRDYGRRSTLVNVQISANAVTGAMVVILEANQILRK
jgi:hypothetical protein